MSHVRVRRGRSWPELVFHVLAHVRQTAELPASVHDAVYVAFVAAHAGPAAERTLAEDAAMLAGAFPTHDLLARAQLVTLLFDEAAQAAEHAERDLADLAALSPRHRELVAALAPVGRGVELLRCASLLEREAMAELPDLELDEATLAAALEMVAPACPELARHAIFAFRALRLRGRLMGEQIWIGAPAAELDLEPSHVAWQAAHEATVGEVGRRARAGGMAVDERGIEHVAVVLLAERARAAALAREHAAWLARLSAPEPVRAALPDPGALLLLACQRGEP